MSAMRAKLRLSSITQFGGGTDLKTVTQENLKFNAVCPPKFNEDGTHEDNTFAKYSPSARHG